MRGAPWTDYHHPTVCPYCSRENELHASISGGSPDDGDVCLCFDCGAWSVYETVDGYIMLRRPTYSEAQEIAADPRCYQVRAAWIASHS